MHITLPIYKFKNIISFKRHWLCIIISERELMTLDTSKAVCSRLQSNSTLLNEQRDREREKEQVSDIGFTRHKKILTYCSHAYNIMSRSSLMGYGYGIFSWLSYCAKQINATHSNKSASMHA